jgi:spore coat polysaccharide biosynthesis predicted glycosyltransferase SpsG
MTAATFPGTLCIRADADARMGIGHVMRCIALAQAWQDEGGKVVLVSAADSPALLERLKSERIKVTRSRGLPGSIEDAQDLVKQAGATRATWVVLDGYHFGPEYRSIIKKADLKLMVIDDLADSDLSMSDLILNHATTDWIEPRAAAAGVFDEAASERARGQCGSHESARHAWWCRRAECYRARHEAVRHP